MSPLWLVGLPEHDNRTVQQSGVRVALSNRDTSHGKGHMHIEYRLLAQLSTIELPCNQYSEDTSN